VNAVLSAGKPGKASSPLQAKNDENRYYVFFLIKAC